MQDSTVGEDGPVATRNPHEDVADFTGLRGLEITEIAIINGTPAETVHSFGSIEYTYVEIEFARLQIPLKSKGE